MTPKAETPAKGEKRPSISVTPPPMPSEQNIIGRVKELQKGNPDGWPNGIHSKNACEVEICKNFPAIAEALLIAVETLDRIAQPISSGKFQQAIAKEALSRIHSLPTNGNI